MMIINKGNFEKARTELLNDTNNAVIQVFENKNNKIGRLSDTIFTLKDVFATEEWATTSSSNILIGFKPYYNATAFKKLIDEGATVVAKVFCDELAMAGTGTYSRSGVITNPLDSKRLVGGSSSGSAATLTKNISFALGSDTGDSVRLPASFIGKVGFKPSYGAVSRWGLFAYASSLDTVSWFTHNVNDALEVAKVLYGIDEKDLTSIDLKLADISVEKPKTIAYLDCFEYLNKNIANKYLELIKKLESKGIKVKKISLNIDLLNAIKPVYDIISFSEASSNLSNLTGVHFGQRIEGEDWRDTFSKTRTKGFGFMVQRRLALGSFYLEKDNQEKLFLRAQKIRRLINDWFTNIHNESDILIYPSSPEIAPLLVDLGKTPQNFMNWILANSNLIGNPSISLKLGEYEKMPFNISIDSKIYNDEKLFSHSLYIEKMINEGGEND
ncbi:MAG: amidase family protein [Metamycoplasmataceae bacterium]